MTPFSRSIQAACTDAVLAASCFHLPKSPTLAGAGLVYIVEVDYRTPTKAIKARLQERFSAPVEVVYYTDRHIMVVVLYGPKYSHPLIDQL